MSYQLRVECLTARVEIQKCKFRSSILTWQVTSSNPRVTSSDLRLQESFDK